MEPTTKSKQKTLFQLVAGPLMHEVQTTFVNERQATYLLASNLRRQVWHLWLYACGAELAQDVAQHLICTKSKTLVAEALDSLGIDDACPGMLNALGKLGQFALAKAIYQNLCDILGEGGRGAKFIMHQDVLTPEILDRLHLLPDALRREEIVFAEGVDIGDLQQIAFILRRRPSLISQFDQPHIGDARRILSILFEQVRKCPQGESLPIVWEGNNTVRPVGSTQELEQLASKMREMRESW